MSAINNTEKITNNVKIGGDRRPYKLAFPPAEIFFEI